MSPTDLPRIVRPAKPGSKRGWVRLTTMVPPETAERVDRLADLHVTFRVEVLRSAVERYLDTELPDAA